MGEPLENPVKKYIEKRQLSIHAAAGYLRMGAATVWRHYHGQTRIGLDAMEAYNKRLKIPLKEMRAWNKMLKETRDQEDEHEASGSHGPGSEDSWTDSV